MPAMGEMCIVRWLKVGEILILNPFDNLVYAFVVIEFANEISFVKFPNVLRYFSAFWSRSFVWIVDFYFQSHFLLRTQHII
jgi:hypothetical protein